MVNITTLRKEAAPITRSPVVEKAQQALEAIESVRQDALCNGDQLTSPLRIGANFTVGPYLFPGLIINLRDSAPQMPLLIEENYTAILTEKLKNGEMDAIIISLPFNEPNILTLPLYEDHKYFLLRMGYRLTYTCTESVTADWH